MEMAEEQSRRIQQLIDIMKKIISVLLVFIMTLCPLAAYAEDDILPAPDWVTTQLNTDASKTVIIKTPVYMIDYIDYYEYSTDGFVTCKTLSAPEGGELIIKDTCEFSLRYYSDGVCSAIFEMSIVINRNTVVNCHSTNISIVIPHESAIAKDITISAFELINGADYSVAAAAMDKNVTFRLYSVSVMRNGKEYNTPEPFNYLFPTDGFDVNCCKVYHMTSKGQITPVVSTIELNMLLCVTDKTGLFIVAEDKTYSTGDLNGDGKVQANDARLALRISSQLDSCTQKQLTAGDINKNGKIDASDARKILRFAASLDII